MEKKYTKLTAVCAAAFLLLTGCGKDIHSEESKKPAAPSAPITGDIGKNAFVITLYPDVAPITCENFEMLVSSGFYDGLTFHRIVNGFMAQGGDPAGNGTGGSEKTIKGEFSSNGVENNLKHKKGTISMARSMDKDSASSQFFICFGNTPNLDGDYAAFGEVTEGMNVVESFQTVERKMNSMGEIAIPLKPVVIERAGMIEKDESGHPRVMMVMKDFPLETASAADEESSEEDSGPTEPVIGENTFIITLYPKIAPISCENFEKLVRTGFYNGLTFHRIVDGFMAQGGDPNGTGTGGSSETIKGEFSENGVENNLSHKKGIVSMARSQSKDSASSQFFICFDDVSAYLDGKYAAFGEVTEGMNVVESFQTVERTANSMGEIAVPVKPVVMEKVTMIENDPDGNPRVQITMKGFPVQ